MKAIPLFAGAIALLAAAGSVARAQESPGQESPYTVSLLGGVHVVNKENTSLPDQVVTIPATASAAYRFSQNWAAEGEVTWFIPVKQRLSLPTGGSVDLKTPDVLAYQANLRASLPLGGWTPYVTGGLGAMTILETTGADRLIQVQDPQTAFAANFGGGATFPIGTHWRIRGDVREFAMFPSNETQGISAAGSVDPIWMERGVVGLSYHF